MSRKHILIGNIKANIKFITVRKIQSSQNMPKYSISPITRNDESFLDEDEEDDKTTNFNTEVNKLNKEFYSC